MSKNLSLTQRYLLYLLASLPLSYLIEIIVAEDAWWSLAVLQGTFVQGILLATLGVIIQRLVSMGHDGPTEAWIARETIALHWLIAAATGLTFLTHLGLSIAIGSHGVTGALWRAGLCALVHAGGALGLLSILSRSSRSRPATESRG